MAVLRLFITPKAAPLGVCVRNVKSITQRAYIKIVKINAHDKEVEPIKDLQTEHLNQRKNIQKKVQAYDFKQ